MPFRAAALGGPIVAKHVPESYWVKLERRQGQPAQSPAAGQAGQAQSQAAQSPAAQSSPQAAQSPAAQQAGGGSAAAAAAPSSAAAPAGSSPAAQAAAGSSPAAQSQSQAAAAGPASQSPAAAAGSETAVAGVPGGPTNGAGAQSAAGSSQAATPVQPTSFSAPSWSTDPGAFISSTVDKGSKGLSQPVIGALAGGIVGGLALIIVAFIIWRQCRGRGEKVAPPPPREVSYRPPTMVGRSSRSMSMTMSNNHRVSSYSTLIAPPASASGHFRPSYYSTYPVGSPDPSIQQDQSPRFMSNSIPSGSPSLSSSGGNTTPYRDGSTGSSSVPHKEDGSSVGFQEHDGRPLQRGLPSADQLSPYDANFPSTDGSESRTTGSDSRTSSPPPSIAGRLPQRNPSMGSLNAMRYAPNRTRSGAPHNRSISITLPRPLSQASIVDSNPTSPTGTWTRGMVYGSNRTTPRTSIYNELGQSTQASPVGGPSGHRRGHSTSSRASASGNRSDATEVDNMRFEGREDIV